MREFNIYFDGGLDNCCYKTLQEIARNGYIKQKAGIFPAFLYFL